MKLTKQHQHENIYVATLFNRMIEGHGKAEKTCDKEVHTDAILVCKKDQLILSNGDKTVSMRHKKTHKLALAGKGKFRHIYEKRKLNIRYAMTLTKQNSFL
ncbi:hypothetical protein CI610_03248 [invertebrate metagenome]|uniref:Uncharacterized protein n=1 Tax=invertebrate metagenome TaxID=1711999 RepID=A0A2H9T3P6_9ZZZZ